MSQFTGLKPAGARPNPVSPTVATAAAAAAPRVSPRAHASHMAGFSEATAAPSIRLTDSDIEYVRGKGGATHTYSQGNEREASDLILLRFFFLFKNKIIDVYLLL